MSKQNKSLEKPPQHSIQATIRQTRGPLPSPDVLKQYGDVLPNGAERIASMAENQQAHRLKMESFYLRHEVFRAYAGIVCGFLLGAFGLGCGTWSILNGHDWAGTVIAGSSLVSLVAVFIKGTSVRQAERERREELNRQLLINSQS